MYEERAVQQDGSTGGIMKADMELRFNSTAMNGQCPSQTIHAGPKSVS